MEKYIFFGLSGLAIFSAIMVLVSNKPIHNLLYLILCFMAIAGHYLLLNAQFLAVVHIIVYAGAIMVLFLFTLMMLNLNLKLELNKSLMARIVAFVSGLLLLVTLVIILNGLVIPTPKTATTQIGMTRDLGQVLFSEYMVPFEAASILFLSAMVGAVMMVNKNK
ncbi:MAG: NADH-quinone oxidoreductase subunit J [Bacteroidota bacterium]|nr:NADH-quinone oxidoreductase subunit J [Bacteroidota bacterium]